MNVSIPEISQQLQYVTLWLVAVYVPFSKKAPLDLIHNDRKSVSSCTVYHVVHWNDLKKKKNISSIREQWDAFKVG